MVIVGTELFYDLVVRIGRCFLVLRESDPQLFSEECASESYESWEDFWMCDICSIGRRLLWLRLGGGGLVAETQAGAQSGPENACERDARVKLTRQNSRRTS